MTRQSPAVVAIWKAGLERAAIIQTGSAGSCFGVKPDLQHFEHIGSSYVSGQLVKERRFLHGFSPDQIHHRQVSISQSTKDPEHRQQCRPQDTVGFVLRDGMPLEQVRSVNPGAKVADVCTLRAVHRRVGYLAGGTASDYGVADFTMLRRITMIEPLDESGPEHPFVPKEYAGKWIAWNRNRTQILASGDRLSDVLAQMDAAAAPEPVFERVPPANVRLVGGGHR